jgi:uncharacterized surface protein with fasciclin (FAS1) repeats
MTLTLTAAAVAMTLGTATLAQQQQNSGQSSQQQGAQQSQGGSEQQGQTGQRTEHSAESGSQERESASSQQRSGDGRLDRVVEMHAELGTFVEALEKAGLVEALAGDTKYTIFAPTNQAFESMQQDVAELLEPENRQQLVSLLRAHIVADDVDPERARQLTAAQTLDGGTVELSTESDKLMVGGASVVTPDIQVQDANLRIYSIDQVLGQGGQSAAVPDGRSRG